MKSILFLCIILYLDYFYPQQLIQNVYLNDIFFSDSLHGCAVGDNGTILYCTDGGINWLQSNPNFPSNNLASVYLLDSLNGFSTDFARILRTYDGGISWQQKTNFNYQIWPITFIDSVTGFIAGEKAFISKTTDKGESWSTMNLINGSEILLFSIGFVNKNEGWAAGSTYGSFLGALFWTEDEGQSWAVIDSSISPYIRDAQFVSATTGFLASLDGIFKTTDKGTTWIPKYQWALYGIYFFSEQIGWAVGYEGEIVKTIDGGETWVPQASPTTDALYSVYFIDDKRGWIAGGWHTTILSTTNGGDNWLVQYSSPASINNFENQPIEFALDQNYPNPFNPKTIIKFSLPNSNAVTIKVYDIRGEELYTLIDEYKQAGTYEVEFNSNNLPSGIFFYRMISGSYSETKKMVLLR